MPRLIVLGHKNPDTDAIVSSLVLADYFQNNLQLSAKALRLGELNNETKYVLENFRVKLPSMIRRIERDEKVALVDHNEVGQSWSGLDFSQVAYIFDHHKLAIETEKPIFMRVEPLGSTASLLAKMFQEKKVVISKVNAKLLLAGILSDTLNLSSPTTTVEDEKIVTDLNKIAQIDLANLVEEMFAAKSSLSGISIEDIISLDYKEFITNKARVGVGVWETTLPNEVNKKKALIWSALEKQKKENQLNYLFFMVVDILEKNSYLYLINKKETELAETIFQGKVKDQVMFLKGIVSRKKQVVPALIKKLS